jgi:FMN phosphatase YigB (HAD superfamily)
VQNRATENTPPRFRHLLVDLDGTLIYSGSILVHLEFIFRILPIMTKYKGWRAAWRTLKEGSKVFTVPSPDKTNQQRLIEVFERNFGLEKSDAEKQLAKTLMDVFPVLEPHFGKIPGAAKFLDWAKGKYSLSLATNPVWPVEIVHLRMRWGGIDPNYFTRITTSDRMHACKPSKQYYEELMAQEGFKPEECLLIGNERKMDLPATKAGIAVFLIRPEAKHKTQIEAKSETSPGAWQGNFEHLQQMLS